MSERSWQSGWFLLNGKDKYVHLEKKKKTHQSTELAVLNLVPRKIMEQIYLETIPENKDK